MAERALHVYAVTDRPAPLPQVEGIAGAPLCAVGNGSLAAICSWGARAEPTEEALWQHEAVAEALMEERTILPARFGIAFFDEARLREELARREEELSSSLRRVAGCVELGLRVLREPNDTKLELAGSERSGRAYMRARLEARSRATEAARAVHEPLARLAVASRMRVLMTDRLLLSACYLVRREGLPRFRAELDGLTVEQPELQLLCTGPWPPYSFAEYPEAADDEL
jgi:Gas vesicle synthesis protein GvpL/GvpF